MKSDLTVEEIISVTINTILIKMSEIKRVDRSVLYPEFKELIIKSEEIDQSQEVLCLRYFKNDREPK